MNMKEDRKVVILVITNIEQNVELFRIHIYEQSIRFDSHFAEGILKHPELSADINEINKLWKDQQIERNQIFPIMLRIMTKYHDYLKDYYFKEYELDNNGHYIENLNMETNIKMPSQAAIHYHYLKASKRLKRISRKEFEKNINSDEIANHYVDNYIKKGARFYRYIKMAPKNKNLVSWYFMAVNEEFKISFSSEIKSEKSEHAQKKNK